MEAASPAKTEELHQKTRKMKETCPYDSQKPGEPQAWKRSRGSQALLSTNLYSTCPSSIVAVQHLNLSAIAPHHASRRGLLLLPNYFMLNKPGKQEEWEMPSKLHCLPLSNRQIMKPLNKLHSGTKDLSSKISLQLQTESVHLLPPHAPNSRCCTAHSPQSHTSRHQPIPKWELYKSRGFCLPDSKRRTPWKCHHHVSQTHLGL